MDKNRHVLVIGGAGYVGSVLVRHLLEQGYRVRVLDALLYNNGSAIEELAGHDQFSFVKGDFCDAATVRTTIATVTDVVMLAALVGDPICRKYPQQARKINDVGTKALIEQLSGSSIHRFVFMSTCSNYGLRDTEVAADETCELNPQSLYAETKVSVEQFLLDQVDRFSFAPTILRGATAYGISPRMRFDLTINEFTRDLALGNELEVYDADTWRPYCHLDDFARAIVRVLEALDKIVGGEVFNLGGSDENFTKRMIVNILTEQLPKAKVRFREGRVDPRNYRVNFEKIGNLLNFSQSENVKKFIPALIRRLNQGDFADSAAHPEAFGNHGLVFLNGDRS